MPYQKLNWEYSEEEKLELDELNLDDARLKLKRQLNHHAKEHYIKEVERLEHSIKTRIEKLTDKKI